ncbi:MAG: acyl-CoA thioesterase [Victivallales bacterium]|nr:acyl-CoA thioesterase [Victivallales bacterium]
MRRKRKYFQTLPGDPPPLSCEIRHRLLFSEADPLVIGWHGRFPQFFEMCHTELMRSIGLTYEIYRRNDIGAPIVQLHTDFYAPLDLDELFTVRAELVWSGGARLNVNYEVTKENGQLAATGYTVQMFFDVYSHTPYVTAPPFVQEIWDKWRNGELKI